MDTITQRIAHIKQKIDAAAQKAGTPSVRLVAAAKRNDADAVREAIAAGVDAVGENRVQEMLSKLEQNAYAGAPLHFIGHLQKNKVRAVVGAAELIESVDSVELAREIDARARQMGIKQEVLLEINIGNEPTKSGFLPEAYFFALDAISRFSGLRVKGLMTIPPNSTIYGENRRFFSQMKQLFIDTEAKRYDNISMEILSMGMSGDYEDAIAHGSNMVRIGTAIFGMRT